MKLLVLRCTTVAIAINLSTLFSIGIQSLIKSEYQVGCTIATVIMCWSVLVKFVKDEQVDFLKLRMSDSLYLVSLPLVVSMVLVARLLEGIYG